MCKDFQIYFILKVLLLKRWQLLSLKGGGDDGFG